MIHKYFIQLQSCDEQKKIRLHAGLYFENIEYQVLSGLNNWSRTWYHGCLYKIIALHPNGHEYEAQINPLAIVANFQNTLVTHEVNEATVSLATKDFIKIVEESFLFRHYVRKGESSKKLIRLAVNEFFNKKSNHPIRFDTTNKVTVINDLYEVDVFGLTEKDCYNGVDDFISRINFGSDLR